MQSNKSVILTEEQIMINNRTGDALEDMNITTYLSITPKEFFVFYIPFVNYNYKNCVVLFC